MNRKKRYEGILGWFRQNVPVAQSELTFENPYQLLVAVILSAQCTDKRVNMHTPALFMRYPTPADLASADISDVFELIKSISFPNNKAAHLVAMAKMLTEEFGSVVPSDTKELVKLPGVGRKTANVIASVIFDKPVIAVDTHVFRVSRRLGLSDASNVEGVEKDLTRNIPAHERPLAHHWILLHGRYVCTARAPHCTKCSLTQWCRHYSSQEK